MAQNFSKYQWKKTVILTKPEGAEFEEIIMEYDCDNVSQFCKKIVNGKIVLEPPRERIIKIEN